MVSSSAVAWLDATSWAFYDTVSPTNVGYTHNSSADIDVGQRDKYVDKAYFQDKQPNFFKRDVNLQ